MTPKMKVTSCRAMISGKSTPTDEKAIRIRKVNAHITNSYAKSSDDILFQQYQAYLKGKQGFRERSFSKR